MSGEKKIKKKKIITYDPDLKLSYFKKIQILTNIKKEKFKIWRKTNKHWIFYTEFIGDIFNYSLCATIIMIPFVSTPIVYGLSIGAAIWLYQHRFHKEIKELLGSIKFVNNVRYGK